MVAGVRDAGDDGGGLKLRHKGTGTLASCTLGELGVLGANPLRGGEENRAKDAKDAKVKGMMDEGTR